MTKEEYKRNLIRMWDSLRIIHKGEKTCRGVGCVNCPLGKVCNTGEKIFRAYDAIEIVESWAKENPIVTNADKFKEVFGFEPLPIQSCVNSQKCENCEYYCDYDAINCFWDKEYKGQTKE